MFKTRKLTRHQVSSYSDGNRAKLIRGGHAYFDLLEKMISSAQSFIHFQVYIFDEDQTGTRIANALRAAARRGVNVHLLVDGYASRNLSSGFAEAMVQDGVNFRRFEPILQTKSYYFGRRLHLKVVVTDGFHGLVGGLNISDRYNDTAEAVAWLDWALFVEGEVTAALTKLCIRRFKFRITEPPDGIKTVPLTLPHVQPDCTVRARLNDWVSRKREITISYREMLKTATSYVIIMSPYFLPGRELRRRMRLATRRGVSIKVILAGSSDIALSKYAERYLYRWLLNNKIEIYEYQKNVLHGKIAVCDDQWMTVGSYNLNNLSAYASIELNLDVANDSLARHAANRIRRIIREDCRHITQATYSHDTRWVRQVAQQGAYNLLRVILWMFTFYFRQKE